MVEVNEHDYIHRLLPMVHPARTGALEVYIHDLSTALGCSKSTLRLMCMFMITTALHRASEYLVSGVYMDSGSSLIPPLFC